MKKILLSLLFALLILTGLVAQNLTLSDSQGPIPNNGNRTYTGDPSMFTVPAYCFVTNNSNASMDVKVKKVELNLPAGTSVSFCWGACYPPNVFVSPTSVPIAAGATNNADFIGDFYPTGLVSEAVIRYVFFDAANENDSACFNVTYDVFPVSVPKLDANSISLSASPNPASNGTTFSVNWSGNATNAKILISDLLGSVVREISLAEKGKIYADLGDLPEGVYFYSLSIDGSRIKTNRLIVRH